MNCLECNKELSYLDHRKSMESFGLEMCTKHRARLEKLVEKHQTTREAIQLYYGLKQAGAYPMLEWWDGKKMVDVAISRVKLNIEIEDQFSLTSHQQAIRDLEEMSQSFKNGFTTIRISPFLVKNYLQETVENILDIVEGLRANLKAV